ncbi:Uncharacterized conserved protein (DUF2358) [Seminavis robusta]|uniref:Uncharacterized conserved protein (DUF2358) n=1 Tax=Seminavis robusta TaxID=568900 RepID=A0A9N8HR29_9STRA|nr:Uncharacterized conserved protein (DUF2358) [Seminavis robusta]|eukprot:Sro1353_g265360.1 Uncharacterized conserved protein (DUF2358) (246) ;mRNA; r:7527-8380
MTSNNWQHRLLLSALLCCLLLTVTTGFSVPQQQQYAAQSTRRRTGASLPESFRLEETAEREPLTQTNGDLPPVIQQIVDERQEFNMNLGKAMDTLRKDMPEILKSAPDYSIYHPEIQVIDPSGVRLTGLDNYKSSIAFFQTFIKFWFTSSSRLQYRMVYDFCRSTIRVSWNVVLIPKVPLGPKAIFLDGISHYKLDATSGKVIEHKIESLVMNDTPIAPPYGIFSLTQQQSLGGGVPVGVGVGAI